MATSPISSVHSPLNVTVPEMPVRWEADETVCAAAIRLALAHRLGAALVTLTDYARTGC